MKHLISVVLLIFVSGCYLASEISQAPSHTTTPPGQVQNNLRSCFIFSRDHKIEMDSPFYPEYPSVHSLVLSWKIAEECVGKVELLDVHLEGRDSLGLSVTRVTETPKMLERHNWIIDLRFQPVKKGTQQNKLIVKVRRGNEKLTLAVDVFTEGY